MSSRLRAQILIALSFIGLAFLWPYYQRAFYRITLFNHVGEQGVAAYGLFLVLLLAGCVIAGLKYRGVETLLCRQPMVLLAAAVLSAATGVFLTGRVVAAGEGGAALSIMAIIGYAVSLAVVSAGQVVVLMRLVYAEGLFQATAVMAASAMAAKLLSPTSASPDSAFGLVPVIGIFIAGVSGVLALAVSKPGDGAPVSYERITDASYLQSWLIPLAAYFVLSISHALRYAFDLTNEVSSVAGEIVPAAPSYASTLLFVLFSGILAIAAVHSAQSSVPSWNRAAFWIGALGVAIGLLIAPMLASFASTGEASPAATVDSGCMILLLGVCVLLLTYQNRLSPIQTFGVLLCGATVIEKIVAYILCPVALAAMGEVATSWAPAAILISQVAALAMLLLFLVRLCQGNVLALLFPETVPRAVAGASDDRRATCAAIGVRGSLSERETDVLYYLSCGYSAKRTGETLFISERTVQTHTRNIYRKLMVHNRQAVIDMVEGERASHLQSEEAVH